MMHNGLLPFFNFNPCGLPSSRFRDTTTRITRDYAAPCGLEEKIVYLPYSLSVGESGTSELKPINVQQFGWIGHQYGREAASSATKNYPVHEMHEMNYKRMLQTPASSFKSANKDVNPAAEIEKSSSALHQIIHRAFIKNAASSSLESQTHENEQEINEGDVHPTTTPSFTLAEHEANISLHMAAAHNDSNQIESLLLAHSSNENFIFDRDCNNETALMIAVKHGYLNIIERLLNKYINLKAELSADEKQLLFDMAVKTKNNNFLNYLFLVAKDVIAEKHEILKKSIKIKSSSAVFYFMNSTDWQDIFRRHPSDSHSPIQLLLHYMPGTAKILFDKCVKENQQKYLNELLDDYPTNSFSIKPLGDALHSLNVAIRTKYEKLFGRGNYTAIKEEHEKTA